MRLETEKYELMSKSYDLNIDSDGDETDEIQGNLIGAINEKLSSRDLDRVIKIDVALKKIENNCYGICEECEQSISDRRLEFNPHFPTCISCAEELELEAKNRKRFSP